MDDQKHGPIKGTGVGLPQRTGIGHAPPKAKWPDYQPEKARDAYPMTPKQAAYPHGHFPDPYPNGFPHEHVGIEHEHDYMQGNSLPQPTVDKTGTVKIKANAQGGLSSKLDVRMDLIPGELLTILGRIFAFGVEVRGYDPGNWKKVEGWQHINHALAHLADFQAQQDMGLGPELAGEFEDHLAHAFWRLGAALWARKHRGVEDMYAEK